MKEYGVNIKSALRFSAVFLICMAAFFVIGFGNIKASATAGDTFVVGGIEYTVNDDGMTVTVSGYDDTLPADVVIPSQVSDETNTYGVTVIGEWCFSNCYFMTSLVIPSGVTCIEDGAFYSCGYLSDIAIPESVNSIGEHTFWSCDSLKSITIPDGVVSIGSEAFYVCATLEEITLSSSVISIGNNCISTCPSLKNITVDDGNVTYKSVDGVLFSKDSKNLIRYPSGKNNVSYTVPDGVVSIESNAFYGCENLKSVTIPDGVISIGDYAFKYCFSLANITIPDSITSMGDETFCRCDALTSITIPNKVTSLGYQIFYGCEFLTSITIPDSVISIGNNAFSNCANLENIIIPDSVTSIGDYAFDYCISLTSVTIPDNVVIGYGVFRDCENLKSIIIPESITLLDYQLFYGCYSLENITIPSSITSIGDQAFHYCHSLTNITIPESVTSVGSWAFANCSSLESIIIPDSVASIGNYAFEDCDNLTIYGYTGSYAEEYAAENDIPFIAITDSDESVEFEYEILSDGTANITAYTGSAAELIIPYELDGYKVTAIGDSAFEDCTSLINVTIPDSVSYIFSGAFSHCTGLKSVTIPDSVVYIDSYSFYGCDSLTSITIPDSVAVIGEYAIANCDSLTSITIPDGVEWIQDHAFRDNKKLTNVTIPDSVTSIGNYLFCTCESLTNITIPDSVTSIGDYAFARCTNLLSIEIPSSVTSIGGYAFYDCENLTSITIPDSVTSIDWFAFAHCDNLTDVKLSDSITSIYKSAFSHCSNLKSIEIPDSVTSIGEFAFQDCISLVKIVIPDSVTSIDSYAFYGCDNLTIYGYTGSYTEEYAAENDIPFVAITDSGTGDSGDSGTGGSGDSGEDPEIPEHDCTAGEKYGYDYDEHWLLCATCKERLEDTAEEHDYPEEYEYDSGYCWKQCTVCGYKDTHAHSFGEYTVKVEPTETETGLRTKACKYCEYVYEDVIPTTADTIYVNEGETYTADYLDGGKKFVVNGGKLTLGEYNINSLTVNGGEAYGGTGTIGSVTINGGTFTSKSKITGDVLVTGGSGGLFNDTVGGTFYALEGTEIEGNLTVEKYGVFKTGGTVKVKKNFTFTTEYEQPVSPLYGTLWIGGNFTQDNQPFKISKVVFYTSASKTISLNDYDDVVINSIWITKEADNGTNLNQVFYFKNAPSGIQQCDNNGSAVSASRNNYLIDYIQTIGWQESLANNLDKLYDSYGSATDTNFFNVNGLKIEEKYKKEIMAQIGAWYAIMGSDYAAETREYSKGCAIVFNDVPATQNSVPRKLRITIGFVDFLKTIKESPYIPVKPVTDGMTLKGLNYQIEVIGTEQVYKGAYNLTASTNQTEFAKGVLRTIDSGIKSDIEALFKSSGIGKYIIKKMSTNLFVDAIMEVYDGYKTVKGEVNKYKKFAGMVTPIYITKYEMEINCPVDAYVYDKNDVLIASIVNNEVVLDNENIIIWVEGESKHIGFNNSGYTVRTVGNGTGTMDYTLRVRDDYFNVMQTSEYYNLPVTLNCEYEYEAGDVNESELVDANGSVIIPDVFGEDEKAATNGHTLTHIPYKAPTFTNSGNIEHWYCTDCDTYFLDEIGYNEAGNVIIPALSPSVTAPSYSNPTTTTSSSTTTTVEKITEVSETETKEDDEDVSDTEENTEIEENTDTTKSADNEEGNDVSSEEGTSSENKNNLDIDSVVSDNDDGNPMTGVTICFTGVAISAVAVMITRKKKINN